MHILKYNNLKHICIYIVISDPQYTKCSNLTEANGFNICAIMKTMCLPVYQHNNFVATHALRHMMLHIAGNNEPKSFQLCSLPIFLSTLWVIGTSNV